MTCNIIRHFSCTTCTVPWHWAATFSQPGLQRHTPVPFSALSQSPLLLQIASNSSDVDSEWSVHSPTTLTVSDSFVGAIVCGNTTRLSGSVLLGQTLYVTRTELILRQAPWSWIARNTSEVPSLINNDSSTVLQGITDSLERLLGNFTVLNLSYFPVPGSKSDLFEQFVAW